jgi:hypothetical protein
MTAKPPQPSITDPEKKNDAGSKQARVIEMLRSHDGSRLYRVDGADSAKQSGRKSKSRTP